MSELYPLHQILETIEDQPEGWLYTEQEPPWSGKEVALVAPGDRDDDDPPALAVTEGLEPQMDIATLQDIYTNLLDQGSKAELEDYLEAIDYYYQNEAFIDLGEWNEERGGGGDDEDEE